MNESAINELLGEPMDSSTVESSAPKTFEQAAQAAASVSPAAQIRPTMTINNSKLHKSYPNKKRVYPNFDNHRGGSFKRSISYGRGRGGFSGYGRGGFRGNGRGNFSGNGRGSFHGKARGGFQSNSRGNYHGFRGNFHQNRAFDRPFDSNQRQMQPQPEVQIIPAGGNSGDVLNNPALALMGFLRPKAAILF